MRNKKPVPVLVTQRIDTEIGSLNVQGARCVVSQQDVSREQYSVQGHVRVLARQQNITQCGMAVLNYTVAGM